MQYNERKLFRCTSCHSKTVPATETAHQGLQPPRAAAAADWGSVVVVYYGGGEFNESLRNVLRG